MIKTYRSVLFSFACILGAITTLTTSVRAESPAKKKIVFVAGNPSHAPGEHEHRAGCMLLADQFVFGGKRSYIEEAKTIEIQEAELAAPKGPPVRVKPEQGEYFELVPEAPPTVTDRPPAGRDSATCTDTVEVYKSLIGTTCGTVTSTTGAGVAGTASSTARRAFSRPQP